MAPFSDRETVELDDDSATLFDRGGRSIPSGEPTLGPGDRLGRYLVREELGRGGMGVVYRAYDPALDREVALKRLHPEHLDRRAKDRLAREAQAMARLSHPHVVTIYDVSTVGDDLLVAMEYVAGPTLRQWLRKPRPWTEVLDVVRQAGLGLAAAHERGLVHRDFKPGNVLLGEDGRTRVLDFGLAVLGDEPSTLDTGSVEELDDGPRSVPSTLTATGAVMGTPAYMAPEQHGRRTSDPRVDQFAFCATLWEGLVGLRPYDGSYTDLVAAKHRGPPSWPADSPVPRRIARAIRRGLAVLPEDRWPDMQHLLAALRPPRRRWPWLLGAGTATTALGATLAWSLGTAPTPCESGDDPLAEIWAPARAQQAEAVLRDRGVALARRGWPAARRTLDDRAQAWRQERVAACRATLVERTQPATVLDLRMACLEQQRQALRAAVDALLAVGPEDAQAVLLEVAGLPSPDRCADVDALQAQLAPPEDPAVARRVQAIRTEVARAHTWIEARDNDSARAAVERLTAEAEATGYDPVVLEVELLEGRLELARGDVDQGVARLTAAYDRAGALGYDRAAVEAAARLAVGTGLLQARHREGQTWGETAVAVAARVGSDREAEALAQDSLGRVLRVRGDYPGSIAAHARALEIREQVHGSARLVTAMTRHRLGFALTLAGRHEQALEQLDRVEQDLEQALGPDHPEVAAVLVTRALVLVERGRYDEAEALYLRAQKIHEATLAPDDPALANVPQMLGNLYLQRSEPERALPHHERSLQIREAAYGPDDPRVAGPLGTVASDLAMLGRLDEAEQRHRRALRLRRAANDEDNPGIALTLNNLGLVLLDQGRLDEAAEAFSEAIEHRERVEGPDAPPLATPLTNLGRLRRQQGRPAEAEALHRRALAMRLLVHGPEHLEVASVQYNLAVALLDQDEHAEAADLLAAAVATVEHALGPEHSNLVEPLREQGRVQLALGHVDQARGSLERARALAVADAAPDSEVVASIDTRLAEVRRAEIRGATAGD